MSNQQYSSFILRLGLAFVVLWFSINQFMNPDAWVGLVPNFITFDPIYAIYLNATFEILLGVMLLIGFHTQLFAVLFAIHLVPIIFSLGYGPTSVRDFGLMIASLSLAFSGSRFLSIDGRKKK
jgi:uncharacterized membrane protein YphA (DoxX/SURF4 family)